MAFYVRGHSQGPHPLDTSSPASPEVLAGRWPPRSDWAGCFGDHRRR
jgi:hypothetical protein